MVFTYKSVAFRTHPSHQTMWVLKPLVLEIHHCRNLGKIGCFMTRTWQEYSNLPGTKAMNFKPWNRAKLVRKPAWEQSLQLIWVFGSVVPSSPQPPQSREHLTPKPDRRVAELPLKARERLIDILNRKHGADRMSESRWESTTLNHWGHHSGNHTFNPHLNPVYHCIRYLESASAAY